LKRICASIWTIAKNHSIQNSIFVWRKYSQ